MVNPRDAQSHNTIRFWCLRQAPIYKNKFNSLKRNGSLFTQHLSGQQRTTILPLQNSMTMDVEWGDEYAQPICLPAATGRRERLSLIE